MQDIYLINKKMKPLEINTKQILLGDIYDIYPDERSQNIKNIIIRQYKDNTKKYDVIHMGEVIKVITNKYKDININFIKGDDTIIYFNEEKKDRLLYIRVALVTMVILIGSIMAIANFHADVNMAGSQSKVVETLTGNVNKYLPYFQVPYSIGIGIGVALFFNKIIPNYAKHEPSPLDLKMCSLNCEIEKQLKNKIE